MNQKIGFIGYGNMAKAMISGILKAGYTLPENIYASSRTEKTLAAGRGLGIRTTLNNIEIARECPIIFLSVKPQDYPDVIGQIKEHLLDDAIIIMIAAGQSLALNEQRFGRPIKLFRSMPNTPVSVGEGMSGLCANSAASDLDKQMVQEIFECFGKAEFIDESLMDTVSGVSGASPAYAFMFIEALADGAVLQGMPRKQAYIFASQALLGSAKMVLETGMHPGQLKDEVCSPGGATIEAVAALEEYGMRNAVIKAVNACTEKSKSMGN